MLDEPRAVEEPGASFGDLAAAAERRLDMTFAASGRVEHRTDAVGDSFGSSELNRRETEVTFVVVDLWRIGRVRQVILPCAELLGEPVRGDVESRRGIGDDRPRRRRGSRSSERFGETALRCD